MKTRRLHGVRVLAAAGMVTMWTDLTFARQPATARRANLEVAAMFGSVVEVMQRCSPTFRRQLARIRAERTLQIRVLPEDQPRPAVGLDARSVITFTDGFPVRADVYIRVAQQAPQLIAHEVEHVLEQLEGIDLQAQAGNGVVWKSSDTTFETLRAVAAGRRVALEVMSAAACGARPGESSPRGTYTAIEQRERDEVPLSARTARISADGRFVALISAARLVEHDRNDRRDLYVFDRYTGRFALESLGRLGQPADGDSRAADISGDGRFVVFAAEAGNLTDAPFTPGTSHVFLRDRVEGTTRLLTRNADGSPANGPSRSPVINAAGTSVVFASSATDLPGAGGGSGIFLVSIATGAVTRVDVAAGNDARPGSSMAPAISADGRYVAFASRVDLADLTCTRRGRCAGDNGVNDVYVRDTWNNVTTRISRSVSGGEPDAASYDPAISGNGRFVAFVSEASNLTGDAIRSGAQIYVHDLAGSTTELVTRTRGGRPANNNSLRPAMSHDGMQIAYQSLASDLLCDGKCKSGQADVNLQWDVYVHHRRTGHTIRASRDDGADWMEYSRAPSLDATGRVLVFVTRHPVASDDDGYDEDLVIQPHRHGLAEYGTATAILHTPAPGPQCYKEPLSSARSPLR